MRTAVWMAGVGLLLACAAERDPEIAAELLVSEDRYRVLLSSLSPASADRPGELRLRVETTGGWHVADEAPARLDLIAPATMAFEPTELREGEVREKSADGFEFVAKLFAESPGAATALGELKFGICEDDDSACVVVREDLSLPLDIAFEN